MKANSPILWSAIALATSMSLTACGGQPAKTEAQPAEAEKAEKTEATTAEATAGGDVIRIATEGAYPPMNLTNADGTLGGFDVDLANALCEQMKANCEIVAQDWDGIIPGLKAEKYDAIIAGMSITDERKEVVDFTDPYFSSGIILLGKAGEEVMLEGFSGTVGAQRSTIASQYLADNYPKVEAKLYDTQENVNIDLANGRLDAVLVDQVVGTDWLSKDEAKGYEQKGETISTGADDFGIAVRKGDELAGKFNKALGELKANGTYDQVSQKYFAK